MKYSNYIAAEKHFIVQQNGSTAST